MSCPVPGFYRGCDGYYFLRPRDIKSGKAIIAVQFMRFDEAKYNDEYRTRHLAAFGNVLELINDKSTNAALSCRWL